MAMQGGTSRPQYRDVRQKKTPGKAQQQPKQNIQPSFSFSVCFVCFPLLYTGKEQSSVAAPGDLLLLVLLLLFLMCVYVCVCVCVCVWLLWLFV